MILFILEMFTFVVWIKQMQNLGEEQGTSSSEESEDLENDDDDDEEDGGDADQPMQCNPS